MGDILRRLAPALRTLGFDCKPNQKLAGTITWTITPTANKVSLSCPASTASPEGMEVLEDDPPDFDGSAGHAGHSVHGIHSFEGAT